MTLGQLQYLVALDTHRHFGDAATSRPSSTLS